MPIVKSESKQIAIPAPNFKSVEFGIEGTAPLVMNKFSEEAKAMMLEELLKMREQLDRIIATLQKPTTTKKYIRSDSELVDELFLFDSSVIDLTKLDCVLNRRDFMVEN